MTDTEPRVLLPIGQDLGPEHTGATSSGYSYRVFDGAQVHELDDEEYAVWSAAAGDPASPEPAWTPELAVALARRSGAHDPHAVLTELTDRGLLAQVRIGSDDAIRFAVLHRIEARMHVLGPSADLIGGAAIGVPGAPLTAVTADCANIYLYGAVHEDLWRTCGALAELSPSEQRVGVPKQLMLTELFLLEAQSLLTVGALCFMRAHLSDAGERR